MHNGLMKKIVAMTLALTMALGLMGGAVAEEQPKTVNIGVTDVIGSLNPLLMNATEVLKYANSLVFLPLVEASADMEYVPQLAESITTEDNLTFTIKLQDAAAWSDGQPVTAKDVAFTLLCMASPESFNAGMAMYAIEGTDDAGMVESGATEISGVKVVSDKVLTVTTKWAMALNTFCNNYGRYVLTLPEHVLGSVPKDQLQSYDWFNHADVISGPYFVQEADLNHYIHYVANDNYWMGAPKIKYLNIQVLDSAQLLTGLQSGEIDLVQQTTGNILLEDYESVKALSNVTAYMGTPITNQSIFINTERVTDVRIRQALLYGIDRQTILDGMVHGYGEIVDGFLCSGSPYYDEALGVTAYDPEKARALIAEAVADGASNHLEWHVNSGDTTFTQAVSFIAAMFQELGLDIEIRTENLDMLMESAGTGDFDVMSVEYTFMPLDPYTDVSWLLSADGWTRYNNEEVTNALMQSQALGADEQDAVKACYLNVDQHMQTDVPMISAYIISKMGVASNRLMNVKPDVFGTFINVHEWDVAE